MLSWSPAHAARRSDEALHGRRSSSEPARRRWPRIWSRLSSSGDVIEDARRRLGRRRSLATEVVLEPHDVEELGRRDLDEPTGLERLIPVDAAHADVRAIAGAE